MRGRRIAFINNQGLDQTGGGVTILRHLTAHFAKHNEVVVFAETRGEDVRGVAQVVLERPREPRGPWWRFTPLLRARHWKRTLPRALPNPDVVVVLDSHFAHAMARLGAKLAVYLSLSAIPRQERFTSSATGRSLRVLQYALLERKAIRRADLTIVASETHAQELRDCEFLIGFEPHVLHPVFPAIERSGGAVFDGDPGKVTILSMARLIGLKNLGIVPELAHALRDLPCEFVIGGDGPERGAIEDRARALGVQDRVHIVGDEVPAATLLRAADVFLQPPSRYESFGMVVFEAMAAGVPPVCARRTRRVTTAMHEFVEHGESGLLIDIDDRRAVLSALRNLIRHSSLRAQLAAGARTQADQMLRTPYAETFERILGERLA